MTTVMMAGTMATSLVSRRRSHGTQYESVAEIGDAYQLLSPLLGTGAAAVPRSGDRSWYASPISATDSYCVPWLRRLLTRLVAIVPAIITVVMYGEHGTGTLLVLS